MYTSKVDDKTENEGEDMRKIRLTPSLFTEEIKEYDNRNKALKSRMEDFKSSSEIDLQVNIEGSRSYGLSPESSVLLHSIIFRKSKVF